ncbi:helix-turn-helix transcriptional regulator, partial [Acinetobacter sp. KAM397]
MPYEEFQRLMGKAGLSIKEFATLLDMNPNSITNYKKIGKVPTHIAVLVYLLSSMKDEGVDFYP